MIPNFKKQHELVRVAISNSSLYKNSDGDILKYQSPAEAQSKVYVPKAQREP